MLDQATYTREQLERGEGFYTTGWTVIVQTPLGRYMTCRREDRVNAEAGFRIVGGGYLQADRTPKITWAG